MRIERALLIAVLIGMTAPASALGTPSASPSPSSQSKGADLRPPKATPDEDMGVSRMKLLAPGIGWAEREVSRDSSDSFDRVYSWTTDNGAHWKNITPHAGGKQKLADFFFLDTHRGWAAFDLPAEEQDYSRSGIVPLTVAATADAGASWSKTPVTIRLEDYLSKDFLSDVNEIFVTRIGFADPLHGWLQVATWIDAHGHGSLLLVTADGGKTWKRAESYPGRNFSDMVLVTPDEGWVFGTVEPDGTPYSLFVTRDGTKSWQELSAEPITTDVREWHEMVLRPGGGLEAEGVACEVNGLPTFQDAVHGFLEEDCAVGVSNPKPVHTTVLFATNDGGRTWKQDRTLIGGCGASTMVGSTWVVPVMKAGHVELLRVAAGASVDARENNDSQSRDSSCDASLSLISRTDGWMLFPDDGTLRSTIDGGRTWTTLTPGHARR
jgi:photosystem II stability/assembly factor-like uncharacterized protein